MAPPPTIRLHPDDGVVIARAALLPGTPVADNVTARDRIPAGHKVAVRGLAPGEAIRRYRQIIGFASAPTDQEIRTPQDMTVIATCRCCYEPRRGSPNLNWATVPDYLR